MKQFVFLCLYYGLFRYLPSSYSACGGFFGRILRRWCCRHLFETCGKNVNIERMVFFGKGNRIRIGHNSGMGAHSYIPNGTIIGNDVMMGPNCYIHAINHKYDRLDIPMWQQGSTEFKTIIIDDDVWIGRNVTIMRGRHIKHGSIVAANCVLTKDFPEYSIIGGNPSRLIGNRKDKQYDNQEKRD